MVGFEPLKERKVGRMQFLLKLSHSFTKGPCLVAGLAG